MKKENNLIKIFNNMAKIYSMGNVKWKPQAYRLAAKSIEQLKEDVSEIYNKGGLKSLEEIPGVGEGIGKKIVEFLQTGKIRTYEELKKTISYGLLEIMDVPGIGPKRGKLLYEKLKIKNLKELEKAAKKGKIRNLKMFDIKSERNILENIKLYKSKIERFPLRTALNETKKILIILMKVKGVKRVSEAGSVRRKQSTVKDLDLLVSSSNPKMVIEKFIKLNNIKKVLIKGKQKASILLKNNMQVDLRVIPDSEFGAALQYFTGNKVHNIALRKIAIKKRMKLNEYGLFKGKKVIASKNEKDIYDKLNIEYVKPEDRKGKNEIKFKKN